MLHPLLTPDFCYMQCEMAIHGSNFAELTIIKIIQCEKKCVQNYLYIVAKCKLCQEKSNPEHGVPENTNQNHCVKLQDNRTKYASFQLKQCWLNNFHSCTYAHTKACVLTWKVRKHFHAFPYQQTDEAAKIHTTLVHELYISIEKKMKLLH